MVLLRWGLDLLFGEKVRIDWVLGLKLLLYVSIMCIVLVLPFILVAVVRAKPVFEILDESPGASDLIKLPLNAFVAMEYYWLILNRTFVVFIAPEGLYGWKALGIVTNVDRTFYEPYQEMLKDDEFMRDRQAIGKLCRLPGGFMIERSAIVSVAYDERQKWGMGGIPHSGRINVELVGGKKREFILLGFAIGDELKDQIATTLEIAASNRLQV
jgi:hypothetical protein